MQELLAIHSYVFEGEDGGPCASMLQVDKMKETLTISDYISVQKPSSKADTQGDRARDMQQRPYHPNEEYTNFRRVIYPTQHSQQQQRSQCWSCQPAATRRRDQYVPSTLFLHSVHQPAASNAANELKQFAADSPAHRSIAFAALHAAGNPHHALLGWLLDPKTQMEPSCHDDPLSHSPKRAVVWQFLPSSEPAPELPEPAVSVCDLPCEPGWSAWHEGHPLPVSLRHLTRQKEFPGTWYYCWPLD